MKEKRQIVDEAIRDQDSVAAIARRQIIHEGEFLS